MEMNKELSKAAEAKLEAAETLEEMVKILAEEGVEITVEQLSATMDANDGELNENDLDNVAGGCPPFVVVGGVIIAWWLWLQMMKRRKKNRR